MRMRPLLALRTRTAAGVLVKRDRLTQPSIVTDRKRGRASSTIVRCKRRPSGVVKRNMARPATHGGNLIHLRQPPIRPVKRITRYRTAALALVSIQFIRDKNGPAIRRQGQKRRIIRLSRQTD